MAGKPADHAALGGLIPEEIDAQAVALVASSSAKKVELQEASTSLPGDKVGVALRASDGRPYGACDSKSRLGQHSLA